MSDTQILLKFMQEQLEKPARAIVNSESAFVRYNIAVAGYPDLAKRYWSWACSSNPTVWNDFTEEVVELQNKLKAIDKQSTIPEWGTKGT